MIKPGIVISDRYEIIDKVGSGGMADVYKAMDQRLNRYVAIKILKNEYSTDKNFVKKFRGEAQSAAGLSHPNIVNVYDVGDDDGLHYIVMELVEGITLKRFIERKGKLEVKEAIGIAIQIAQGLEAAHDNHIVHRDIKPQNIIISKEGKVKVTDFGIAKATNSNTITSNAMGSVHYLSPEQARGGYSDEKSDIYSLGVTIYEMMSGKVPFAGDNNVSIALLHIQGEATPLRELDSTIPISIDKIVQKCMQKRPERRYHSASELISDLKKSITNPNGDFVQIPAFVASDSPTINISDDLGRLKGSTYLGEEPINPVKNQTTGSIIDDEEEEDDLDTVDTKVEKFFLVGSIVTVFILAAIIIFIVIKFMLPIGKGDETPPITEDELTPTPTVEITPEPTLTVMPTYTVPNVVSLTEEDAKAKIAGELPEGYELNVFIEPDYSDEYEKGHVIKQYPEDGIVVNADKQIVLTISVGPDKFELPYVVNLTEEQAETKLGDDNGLIVKHEYEDNNEVPKGYVISTDPEPYTMVAKGDTVTIYISNGPKIEQVIMPKLIGLSETAAQDLLESYGLSLGNVDRKASDDFPKGEITYQSETAGQLVDKGTSIDVIISTGPEDVPASNNNPEYIYIGKVTIDINPFEHLGISEGNVVLEMAQDEWVSTIYDEHLTIEDEYPFTVTGIEGESETAGIVTMYVEGVPFVMEGETSPKIWTVHFEAVEE